jgi:hypothetical protein
MEVKSYSTSLIDKESIIKSIKICKALLEESKTIVKIIGKTIEDEQKENKRTTCDICSKSFKTREKCEAHGFTDHRRCLNLIDPMASADPVDSSGLWVKRIYFPGEKSFGIFRCTKCFRVWNSAHSYREMGQACKVCGDEWVLPSYMWLNAELTPSKEITIHGKPHDKARCEACKRGKCRLKENC